MLQVLEVDIFSTAYTTTLDKKTVLDATIRMVDWSPELVLDWLQRLQTVDVFHFGSPRDHFDWENHNLGAVFWGNVMLCATKVGTTSKHHRTLRWERAAALLSRYLPGLLSPLKRSEIGDAARKDEFDDQHPVPATDAKWKPLKELEDASLKFIAMITVNDLSVGNRLRDSSRFAVASACRRLRDSRYSLEKPCEHLGEYLHAQAHLLAAFAITGDPPPSAQGDAQHAVGLLHQAVGDALSDLSTVLRSLSRHLDSPASLSLERNFMEQELLSPVSRIIRTLSIYLPSFRPLLPPEFDASLDVFFSALERSNVTADIVNISVATWYFKWTTAMLYDTGRQLVTKMRSQDFSGEDLEPRSLESAQVQGNSNAGTAAQV
ncbi:hypothetical protein GY45DRAFT_595975 [Cubamyces sp. BRFM 1775]|nr:hypothetical protein GY45DRAFT_595975 [Cubamyces sp. BRFM 1775]